MGIFARLRSVFANRTTKPIDSSTDVNQSVMITAYDKFGRQVQIPRDEWRRKVLPDWLKQHWDNPDALYSTICMSMNDGFFEDVLAASERLVDIDPNRERSSTIRGIVLMKTGDLNGAEAILQGFIDTAGPTGTVLTNLAKVYAERGNQGQAEDMLWRGLQLDPNQDNGLLWWAVIHRERDAANGFTKAMKKAAAVKGSWRPQLWLARECLEKRNLAGAKAYYDHILKLAADRPDVLMMISGDLGKNGYVTQILNIVLPLYDVERHDVGVGHNILQAYLETGLYVDGEKFLHRMFTLNRPDLKNALMFYAAEFDKLKEAARTDSQTIESPVDVSAVCIDSPIWYYGLHDPKWLFLPRNRPGKTVVFISLANSSPTTLTKVTEQREDDIGRLTRSIPLYLMESLFFWTDMKPSAVIPIVTGKGPAVSHHNWSAEQIDKFTEGMADLAVVGKVEQENNTLAIRLSVWDCSTKRFTETFEATGPLDDIGMLVHTLERQILAHLASLSATVASSREGFYLRPAAQHMGCYLVCLAQSLMGTLAHNKVISAERFWGERNVLENCLAMALELDGNQVPRILFLSSLAHNKAYGSVVFREFQRQSLALLEDEKSHDSEFYRLSPFLFVLFDMSDEFARRKSEFSAISDPNYQKWLDDLTTAHERT